MIRILYLHAGAEMYGADKVLLDLISNLDKDKFEIHIILPCDGELVDKLREAGAKVTIIEYPILRRKYFNFTGIIKYLYNYFSNIRKIIKYAKENNIDIIHNNTVAVLEGIYISRTLRIPLLWHVHEIIVKPKIIYKMISFLLSISSRRVISVSNAVRDSLLNSGFFKDPMLIKTIYNGVDNRKYKILSQELITSYKRSFNIPDGAKIIGMVGRVNSWKGQDDFLNAMENVFKRNNNAYAFIVGGVFSGEEWRLTYLKEKINSSKYRDRIIFLDFQKDTVKLFNLFDIFVLPSINPDPLPTVILEAMACGKPIVGYNHGGVVEMVKNNGILVEPKDYNKLGDAIDILINNENMLLDFSEKSISRQRKEFSLESYINNFEQEYKELLKSE